MINKIKQDAKKRMEKTFNSLKNQISKIRTGRASPGLLGSVMVEYYGATRPLHQLANIIAEDSRTLVVTLFDSKLTSLVEKAIMESDLGFNPFSVGATIRVFLPPLTEERRKGLIKVIRNDAEQGRISIRGARRDANDKIKDLLKGREISEDDEHRTQDEIQNLTNIFIKKIDEIIDQKEKELMEF